MKKKVLIVSRLFSPYNTIGAIRPTKLSKYLNQHENFEVDVITSKDDKYSIDSILEIDVKDIPNIYRISNSEKFNKVESILLNTNNIKNQTSRNVLKVRKNNKNGILNWFKKFVKHALLIANEYDYYRQLKKHEINYAKYDIVVSTYSTLGNVLIANFIKKKGESVKWVADFRDPIYVDSIPFGFKRFMKLFLNKYLNNIDAITTVSEGTQENLFLQNYKKLVQVIPNGYDLEDIDSNIQKQKKFEKFTLTYTGQLYSGKRDLSILFKAIKELITEGVVNESDIMFSYAGNSYNDLFNQANKYDLTNIISDNGLIERKNALILQKRSHILVMATWNNSNSRGIVTGKFLEYMMINNPIISLVNGNLEGSKVKEIMNYCDLGITYESPNHDKDFNQLKEYLLRHYLMYKQGEIIFSPNKREINRYNYKEITENFIHVFNEC
ncbi:glycosyltransferase [Rossellomorea sp. FM04394]|uniref:glycosyltransferase n=1 Tax=Rossellomorea sp. FM04394 TaxID=3243076 RepID=UPI0035A675A9